MVLNVSEIFDRIKLFFNAKSDNDLSIKLGKYLSYVSQQKKRNTIDFDLIFSFCENIDFNWLVTGNSEKNRLIALSDEKTGRKIVDLNEEHEKLIIEHKQLKEEISLFKNIVRESHKEYGKNEEKEG